jgi:hypothetical protein
VEVRASYTTPFTLQDHCEVLAKHGLEDGPNIWFMEDDKVSVSREWEPIKWDSPLKFKKGSVILFKMGAEVITPYD